MAGNNQKQPSAPPIALSLKTRGLTVTPAIPRKRQQLLSSLGQSVVDISIAICVQIILLSWSAWISVLLVILCCVFYANYKDGAMAAAEGSIMIPIALLIYLPCLGLLYTVSSNREQQATHRCSVHRNRVHKDVADDHTPLSKGLQQHLQASLVYGSSMVLSTDSPPCFGVGAQCLMVTCHACVSCHAAFCSCASLQTASRRLAAQRHLEQGTQLGCCTPGTTHSLCTLQHGSNNHFISSTASCVRSCAARVLLSVLTCSPVACDGRVRAPCQPGLLRCPAPAGAAG